MLPIDFIFIQILQDSETIIGITNKINQKKLSNTDFNRDMNIPYVLASAKLKFKLFNSVHIKEFQSFQDYALQN